MAFRVSHKGLWRELERERLTVQEAAAALGITEDGVRKRVSRGQISSEKVTEGQRERLYVFLDPDEAQRLKYQRKYRSFTEAREFARSLHLKSEREWEKWCKTGERPPDIPSKPRITYRDRWRGMGDWLGTYRISTQDLVWRPFDEARMFARSLDLKRAPEWEKWCKTGERPPDIPSKPRRAYPEEWRGWRDWLGTEEFPGDRGWDLSVMFWRFSRAFSHTTHERLKNPFQNPMR